MSKYIIWAYFGQDGWSIVFETDDKDVLLQNYLRILYSHDGKVLVTKNIPIVLEMPND